MTTPTHRADKSFTLLRRLAAAGPRGISLAELHAATALPKPTLHRLLAGLLAEGMAIRAAAGRRYQLGPEVFALATQARASIDLVALWRPALRRIVERSGDSAFLLVRSGADAVCLAREDGMIQIRSLTDTIGGRVPLGLGQGSAAILAGLPQAECDALLAQNAPRLAALDPSLPAIARAAVAQVRAQGYAHGGGVLLEDVAGVAVPVPPRLGLPDCALSLAGLRTRLQGERLAEMVRLMAEEVRAVAATLAS